MKRITMILLAALTFTFFIYAKSRTATPMAVSTPVAQAPSKTTLTQTARDEYIQLVKSKAGESSVRSWAQRHKLTIVSLKGYDFQAIPETRPTTTDQPQQLGACDAKKCPTATGGTVLKNTLGQNIGIQSLTCTASSCKWVWNADLKSYLRICENWKCTADGAPQRF